MRKAKNKREKTRLIYNQRATKRYGLTQSIPEQVSQSIDSYRLNYINNLHYILKYVGLTLKAYNSIMKSMHIKGVLNFIHCIEGGITLGFDIFHAGALAKKFRLPVALILEHDIEREGIVLQDYGVIRNEYVVRRRKNYSGERVLTDSHLKTILKNNITRSAQRKSDRPVRLFNARLLLNLTIGERSI